MGARVETINKLDIYTPSTLGDKESIPMQVAELKDPSYSYFFKRHDLFITRQARFFPVVLLQDDSPWGDANRYLLYRTQGVLTAKPRTLESIARDLVAFRQWLDMEHVDYLDFPKRTWSKPTYRYCGYLHEAINNNRIAISTAKRRMVSVQGFYRWLQLDGHKFEHALWRENDSYIAFKDRHGFNRSKSITQTDLTRSFKHAKNSNNYSEYIEDGGKLRPLPKDEQIALVNALKEIGNTEMTLSFLLALTTGARLQTVFTLRTLHFKEKLEEEIRYKKINAGKGTLINTKFNKQVVIEIPDWLYNRIRVYLASERYKSRHNRSTHVYPNENEQYVFLTRDGRPYYLADNDPFSGIYRDPPRGNSITQFIRQQLYPTLRERGHLFSFRFHDLRASFGTNLIEDRFKSISTKNEMAMNNPLYFSALMYVRERMGHSHISTTERYLQYKSNFKIASLVQSEFEAYLEGFIE